MKPFSPENRLRDPAYARGGPALPVSEKDRPRPLARLVRKRASGEHKLSRKPPEANLALSGDGQRPQDANGSISESRLWGERLTNAAPKAYGDGRQ